MHAHIFVRIIYRIITPMVCIHYTVYNVHLMRILARGIRVLWQQWTNSHGLQKSCGEKGTAWPLSK